MVKVYDLPKVSSGAMPFKEPVESSKVSQPGFSDILNVKVSPLLSKVVGVKEKVSPTLVLEIVPEIVGG